MSTKNKEISRKVLIVSAILALCLQVIEGFVGLKETKCSLDPDDFNNPCPSLYDADCDGAHCKCPSGTHEDKNLKRCVKGGGGGGGGFDDLPFDYVPGKKPEKKPTPAPPPPGQPQPKPPPPPVVPNQPQAPVEDPHIAEKTGGGIGGGLGFLILIGLVYFCCCRGEKGKNLRSKLPFFKGGGQNANSYQMPQQQPSQYPNAPNQYPNAPPPGPEQYPQ